MEVDVWAFWGSAAHANLNRDGWQYYWPRLGQWLKGEASEAAVAPGRGGGGTGAAMQTAR